MLACLIPSLPTHWPNQFHPLTHYSLRPSNLHAYYLHRCDKGGDCECMCTAVAAFATECYQNGVYVQWRSRHFCRKIFHRQSSLIEVKITRFLRCMGV